jgi:hypothetical protein
MPLLKDFSSGFLFSKVFIALLLPRRPYSHASGPHRFYGL